MAGPRMSFGPGVVSCKEHGVFCWAGIHVGCRNPRDCRHRQAVLSHSMLHCDRMIRFVFPILTSKFAIVCVCVHVGHRVHGACWDHESTAVDWRG